MCQIIPPPNFFNGEPFQWGTSGNQSATMSSELPRKNIASPSLKGLISISAALRLPVKPLHVWIHRAYSICHQSVSSVHKISLWFHYYYNTTKLKSPPTIQPPPSKSCVCSLPTNAEPVTFGFINLFRDDIENPWKEKTSMVMAMNRDPRGWISSATDMVWTLHKQLNLCAPISSPSTSPVKFPHSGFQYLLNRKAVKLDQIF